MFQKKLLYRCWIVYYIRANRYLFPTFLMFTVKKALCNNTLSVMVILYCMSDIKSTFFIYVHKCVQFGLLLCRNIDRIHLPRVSNEMNSLTSYHLFLLQVGKMHSILWGGENTTELCSFHSFGDVNILGEGQHI